jgi:sulfur carrier protein
MSLSIKVNGDPRESQSANVRELVAELALVPETVLVEHNGLALHRSEWETHLLADGDQIEILRVAAGG